MESAALCYKTPETKAGSFSLDAAETGKAEVSSYLHAAGGRVFCARGRECADRPRGAASPGQRNRDSFGAAGFHSK